MKTLMIQVLGVGLIPRGKGIAPKKEPFPATKKEIELIMEHGTLQPRMKNPNTGKFVEITSRNFEKLWNTFAVEREEKKNTIIRHNVIPKELPVTKKEESKPETKPVQPQQVQFTKQNDNRNQNKPKWEQKQEQKQDKPAEEPKKEEEKKNDESFTVTTSSDKK